MAMLAVKPRQPHLLKAISALSALQGTLGDKQRVMQALTVVDDLLDGVLRQSVLSEEDSRVVRQAFGILCSSLREGWCVVEDSTVLLRSVAGRACEVLEYEDEAVMFVACQFLSLFGLSAPNVLLSVPQLRFAIETLLAQPVPSPVAVSGVQILIRLLTSGLGLRPSRCGAVVDLAAQDPLAATPNCSSPELKTLVTESTVKALCGLLSGCVGHWGLPGVSLARRIMNVLSILLYQNRSAMGDEEGEEFFSGLSSVIITGDVPSLVMEMVRVALGTRCPISLLTCNDLFQHVCVVEPSVTEDLVEKVFDASIMLDSPEGDNADSAVSCLFWMNSLSVAVCQSRDLSKERILDAVSRREVLKRIRWFLGEANPSHDLGWFLIVTHISSAVMTPLLIKFSKTTSLQDEILQTGLFDVYHRCIDVCFPEIRQRAKSLAKPDAELAELEATIYIFCNMIFFYTLALHNHPKTMARGIALGVVGMILDSLRLYSELFSSVKVVDLASLGARILEESLTLLAAILFHLASTGAQGQTQIDKLFVQKAGVELVIGQIIGVAESRILSVAQRRSLLKKQLEAVLHLSRCLTKDQNGNDALTMLGLGKVLEDLEPAMEEFREYEIMKDFVGCKGKLVDVESCYSRLVRVYRPDLLCLPGKEGGNGVDE